MPVEISAVDMAIFSLPLDRYFPDQLEASEIRRARDSVMVECLRRFGFSMALPEWSSPPVGGKNERRYLLASLSRAREFGYKWPEISQHRSPSGPVMAPQIQAVLSGAGSSVVAGERVPEGGCHGEADRRLKINEAPGSDLDFLRRLDARAYTAMKGDARILAAIVGWSACMKKAGFDYPDPGRANDDPAFNTIVASVDEIATAVADVSCKEQVGLVPLMAAIEVAFQNREIEGAKERLGDIMDRKREQIGLAREILRNLR
ncbi:hypothetical protein [Micromonospora haikouensis]|uniref:hypothetical protein n=1 Tax=Micromonospora haikouensis TaxID=686309 RepID=UPI003D756ADA